MKLANENEISQANLSRWFKNQKGGYVKEEKIERMATYLGVNYISGKLFPGVHKWSLPSPTREHISRCEKTVQTLMPGGGTIFQIRLGGILNPISTEGLITTLAFVSWVLVPDHFQDVRLILRIGYYSRTRQLLTTPPFPFSSRLLIPANMGNGWRWNTDDSPDTDTPKKWIVLERNNYKKLMEEDFTVEALDNFLGLSNEDVWTWERLISVLKNQGRIPREVAQELGLVERDTK